MNNHITRSIFEGKYPYKMPYKQYLILLEKGFELLENNAAKIDSLTELSDLKAIRMALEYRFEVMRRFRKNQINRSLGSSVHNLLQ